MPTLRVLLGDQLTRRIAALSDLDPERDTVPIAEVVEEATYVRHHKQKIAFLFSAMRHFADELREEGIKVVYSRLDDAANTGSLAGEVERVAKAVGADGIVVTEPGEWRVLEGMRTWSAACGCPVEIRDDNRFLCSRAEFAGWAEGRKTFVMEHFYRVMRRLTGLLMNGKEPEGDRWNYDQENRKPLRGVVETPPIPVFEPDETTREVLDLVAARFADHFGELSGFRWAVTRRDALLALADFIDHRLDRYGDFQDAMLAGNDFLFHSALSPYLNAGLLVAQEVAEAVERAYREGRAPLNAAEGFIRQVIGWREYVRGIYWTSMPSYATSNALAAERPLPWFFWSGETQMNCIKEVVGTTARHAWAHHIQRLMVTGNFALIAGLAPAEVEAWYLIVYLDAYEWVELPNVHGMILFADGGVLASKPYAASGAYIDRMSDYCRGCAYDVKVKAGETACPFNYLYWDFLIRNETRLRGNMRLAMPYRTLDKMPTARRREIAADSERFLASAQMSPEPPKGPARPVRPASLF